MNPAYPPYSSTRPSLYGTGSNYPYPRLNPGFSAAPPPNVGAPKDAPTDSDPEELAKSQAKVRAAQAAAVASGNQVTQDFRAGQVATQQDLAQKQAPFLTATAARRQAQAAAGIDPAASPEMAARQLGQQATAGVQDPVDAQRQQEASGLVPGTTGTPQQQQTNALTAALQTAQAARAGVQTASIDDAYAKGRAALAPIPGAPGAPRPLTATMTPGALPVSNSQPTTPAPAPGRPAAASVKPVKPLKPTRPINSRRLVAPIVP